MNRRTALKIIGAGGLMAVAGGSVWLMRDHSHKHQSVDLLLQKLTSLNAETITTNGAWSVARVFDHLAQSVEYSMSGFPQLKSNLFQNSVGQLAFNIFEARGGMSHSLSEDIPGEVVAPKDLAPATALRRLVSALEQFETFEGQLKPHFAYGALSKSEYAVAHAMHVDNHFEELVGHSLEL